MGVISSLQESMYGEELNETNNEWQASIKTNQGWVLELHNVGINQPDH